jgi:dTDP-4-dehydrorhamnose 3,5-epimerase
VQPLSTDWGLNAQTAANVAIHAVRSGDAKPLDPLVVIETEFAELVIIQPRLFEDPRGYFMETFHRDRFIAASLPADFVQDNHSLSRQNVLRGLHYQIERPQGKLVRAVHGAVYDVAVDLRRSEPTFGRWFAIELSAANRKQVYIPPGFAHGFCALSDFAEVIYKCTDVYYPAGERTIVWNDRDLAIRWPMEEPILAPKDGRGLRFAEAPYFS